VLPRAVILLWVFHLVLCGVLIPNTARRSAIIVGTWVATAIVVMLVTSLRLPLAPGQFIGWAANVLAFLVPTGGFAIFNSARINAYRREAATARKVGNYLLVRRLGGGGMGDVFLAYHRLLKRPCAVKLIRPERAGDVKLLDFGLVFDAESGADQRLTQVGGILGTPAYMSPEQARGETDVGPSSDLYSLGAVGYFLLTGRPPFQGRGGLDVLNAHLTAAVVPPSATRPDVPPGLEAIVLKLLAKGPADRFSDAESLDRALSTCGIPAPWADADAVLWWERRTTDLARVDTDPIPTIAAGASGVTAGATGP
jgi:hypothetical protein